MSFHGQGAQAPEDGVLRVEEAVRPLPAAHAQGRHAADRVYGQETEAGPRGRQEGKEEAVEKGRLSPSGRGGTVSADRFVAALNAQIGNELAAHNQYLACAVHYDAETMPQMATFFYTQALEERDHAMMMVRYLLDTDSQVEIPGVEAPQSSFSDVVAPIALAPDQEKRVTEQVNSLLRIAREESDFASEQFLQWFIKEQVEEVATVTDLLAIVRRNADDVSRIEDYVAREATAEGADPTAPRVAGAAE